MDNYEGDLADIVRASGSTMTRTTTTTTNRQLPKWRFGESNLEYQQNDAIFPFPTDALCLNMDAISTSTALVDVGGVNVTNNIGGGGGGGARGRGGLCSGLGGLVQVMRPGSAPANNLSSNIVQISPDNDTSSKANCNSNVSSNNDMKGTEAGASPKVLKGGYGFMSNQMISANNTSCSSPKASGFVNGSSGGVQIPSPRNQGIKRRKIQAKKVVCIPAPAVANSRQTGEVVPSDLWAWRKYGQKPIKGSPYPRGYYRCSSSKGCSARKQVERSRTDPNMLVITYTSEHNHPWPTQRNALAGSTRSSQPSKTASKSSPPSRKQCHNNYLNVLGKNENQSASTTHTYSLNEEITRLCDDPVDENSEDIGIKSKNDNDSELFNDSYRPLIVAEPNIDGVHQQVDQDFFADLVEFEGDDPLGLDPFTGLFDWATNNTNTNTNTNTITITNVEDNDHTTTM